MSLQQVLPDALPLGDVLRREEHLHLDPRPELISQARRFVVSHAGPVDDDTRDVLQLLTSELVTNAVLHARTSLDLGVATSDRSIVVLVEDAAPAGPSRDVSERDGGRGLSLVNALADEWDIVHHDPEGKTAWFRLARSH